MKTIKSVLPKAGMIFLIFTLLCGVIYTGVVTGIAQLIFSDNANGSIIEVDGKKYGCELLGQQYTDESHMWGRIMNIDVSTYTDENGKALMYAAPPTSLRQVRNMHSSWQSGWKSSGLPTRIWMKQLFRWTLSPVPAVGLILIFPRQQRNIR